MELNEEAAHTLHEGLPIGCCSNCCEPFHPIGTHDPPEVPSYPVYELTIGEEALKINTVLDRIFRLASLRDLNEYEMEENIPLCPNCANILSQLDVFFQAFDRVRRFDSYLSAKINQLDEVIESGVAGLRLQLQRNNEDAYVEGVYGSENQVIKTETGMGVPPQIQLRASGSGVSGPWVVLERLELKDSCSQNHTQADMDLDSNPGDDIGNDYVEELDTEPILVKAEEVSKDISEPGSFNMNQKERRVSKRNLNKSVTKTKEATTIVTVSVVKKVKASAKKSRTNCSKGEDLVAKNVAKKGGSKSSKSKSRAPEDYRKIEKFHLRKQLHPCPCQYCLEDFDLESDRVEHLKETHCSKHHSVICPPCGKLFASEDSLKSHKSRCGIIPSHFMLPPFICKDCGKEFKRRWCLQLHQRYVHVRSNERPFACDECDHKAKTAEALGLHKKFAHAAPVPVECPECKKTLKNQPCFEEHFKRMHTPHGYERYKVSLQKHLAKAKEAKRRNRVETSFCSECGIDFQTVTRYRTHRDQVHVTAKKFQCEQCGKGFNRTDVLKNHMHFVHTDERPYICDQCGISFKSPKTLRTHLERVHSEEGRAKINEYNRVNYRRKRKIAEQLSKVRNPSERLREEATVTHEATAPEQSNGL